MNKLGKSTKYNVAITLYHWKWIRFLVDQSIFMIHSAVQEERGPRKNKKNKPNDTQSLSSKNIDVRSLAFEEKRFDSRPLESLNAISPREMEKTNISYPRTGFSWLNVPSPPRPELNSAANQLLSLDYTFKSLPLASRLLTNYNVATLNSFLQGRPTYGSDWLGYCNSFPSSLLPHDHLYKHLNLQYFTR